MRKTRLVILPGARCLNQIGCLLLFLACPMIAFKGQENREVEPYCRLLTLRQRWLSDDQEVAEFNTCKYEPTGYKWEQDDAYWKTGYNQSYDTSKENGLLTTKSSFVRNTPLVVPKAKPVEQIFLNKRISRTRVEVNTRSRDAPNVQRSVAERKVFLQGPSFVRTESSGRDSRTRQERISRDSAERSRRISVDRDSRLNRNRIEIREREMNFEAPRMEREFRGRRVERNIQKPRTDREIRGRRVERSIGAPRMDRDIRGRTVDRNIEKSRMDREIRERRAERSIEAPRMDREIRESRVEWSIEAPRMDREIRIRRVERNIEAPRMDREIRERRAERSFEKARMNREMRERRVERYAGAPRMDRETRERRVERIEDGENRYMKRFVDAERRETRKAVSNPRKNLYSPQRSDTMESGLDRRELRAASLERTRDIRRNDLRSTQDIRRERRSVSLERFRETREPQAMRNRFFDRNTKEEASGSRRLEDRRNERASERLNRVVRDVQMAREERRLGQFNRDSRVDELKNNLERQSVSKDRLIRETIRSDRRANSEERRASLERRTTGRLADTNRRVLTERADRDTRDFRSFRNIRENRVQIRQLASKDEREVRNAVSRREIRSDRVERLVREGRDSREREIYLERRIRSVDNTRESRVSLLERAHQLADNNDESRKEVNRRIRERETRSASLNNRRTEIRNQNSPYFRSASRRNVRAISLDRIDQARDQSRKETRENARSVSFTRAEREIRETRVNNRIETESDSNIRNNRKIRQMNERERLYKREIKFEHAIIRTDRVRDDRRNNIRMVRNDKDSRFRQSERVEKLSESNKHSLSMLVNGKPNQETDQIMTNYGLNNFIPSICDKVSGLKSLSIRLWNSSMNVLGMKNTDSFISGGIMAVSIFLSANKKAII